MPLPAAIDRANVHNGRLNYLVRAEAMEMSRYGKDCVIMLVHVQREWRNWNTYTLDEKNPLQF